MRGALRGALGGIVGTVAMTLYRAPVARSLPPTAEFWAQYVGEGEPEDYPGPALALHLLYGAAGGVVFGALFDRLDADRSLIREALGAVCGAWYGLSLSAFGQPVILRGLLGQRLDASESFLFHAGHVVYGLVLGHWAASRQSDSGGGS
ncbi:hypothetical protein BRC94_05130 [Halobacteriales archaeon QS_5_70_17]|nr:MAG: hypothetical protein BRC94_05130 [Halobacteriales archaeon QS_5_70_17]